MPFRTSRDLDQSDFGKLALDDVCVMVIERSVFLQRLEQYPKIARDLLTLITNRLVEVVAGSDEKPE